ncbi:MAG: DUF58 domain-containing protein, partial [Candidatus Dormibacteria bacterium]
AMVLFLVGAVLVRSRSIAFWLYLALLVFLAARLVVRLTLERLRVVHRVDRDHLFPGERVAITLTVANRSPLPAPWVWVEDHVPAKLHHGPVFSHVSTLPAGSERVHRYEVQVTERGLYRLGQVEVSVGDWFGLRELGGTVQEPRWLTVYPRVVPVQPLRLPNRLPVGPRRDPLSPFQDLLPIGLRRYFPGDPLRLIAWKASAHRDELMVKEQPLVRERVTYYFLNLSRRDWDPARRFELMERVITIAASLVWWEPDPRHSLGMVAYGRIERAVPEGIGREVEAPGVLRVPARAGAGQRRAILEALAGLQPADGQPFLDLLSDEVRRLPWGATLVMLVPTNTNELVNLCTEFQRRGHPVVILTLEPRRTMNARIPIHEVELGGQEVRFA